MKHTDKGFPFHSQELKNNFLYQRRFLGDWGFFVLLLWGGAWHFLAWAFSLGFFCLFESLGFLFGCLLFLVFFLRGR